VDITVDVIQIVVAAAAGVIFFVVSEGVLRHNAVFSRPRLLAFCAAVLAVMGLMTDFVPVSSDGPHDPAETRSLIEFILPPYDALAIPLVLLLLLAAAQTLLRRGRRRLR